MTNLAVCGVGNIGTVHLENLLSIRGCRIGGIFDISAEKLERAAHLFNLRAYASAEELFADEASQAVVIATPTSSHRELCCRALEMGKHVFLEKPLAGTLEDATAILTASKASDRIVQIGFAERFNAQYMEAKRAIESGTLGTPRFIRSSRVVPYHMADPTWELGVFDTAVHDLDLLVWLMGSPPSRVMSKAVRVYADSAIPHSAVIVLTFENGALAVDHISWLQERAHPLSQCARSRMFIQGDLAAFEIDLEDRPSSITSDEKYQKVDSVIIGGRDYYGCLKLQFEYFLQSVEEGAPVRAPVEDAVVTERVAMAALESLRSGREVPLVADA